MTRSAAPSYVCGYSRRELERLELQGAYYAEITRLVLERAGLARGMRVLDIGCGVGDVSVLAAELVGTGGSVLGIDRAPQAVAAATERAAQRGLGNVVFRVAEIEHFTSDAPLDALVGRFVLMHQADPARALRAAAGYVRPGGLVAIIESHLTGSTPGVHSHPHSPTYDRVMTFMVQVIGAAGAHPNLGLRLREVFVVAGLPAPELWLQARVEGGPDAALYRYVAESARSMLAEAERRGLSLLSPDDVDQLEDRLRREVTASGGVLTSPLVVGAWCRLP